MSKFKVSVRFYSAVDHKLVWVSNNTWEDEEALKSALTADHVRGLQTVNLYRTVGAEHERNVTHECIRVMRTNIMVRDESGNLVKWKHLVK